jgi:hypothetical protein
VPRDGKESQECSDSVFRIKEDGLQLLRTYHLK